MSFFLIFCKSVCVHAYGDFSKSEQEKEEST